MRSTLLVMALLALTLAACGMDIDAQRRPPAFEGVGELPKVKVVEAFANLRFYKPLYLCAAPGDNSRLFVVTQQGQIHVFKNDPEVERTTVFLDIQSKILADHNEEGLLALAFHPDYAKNGYFYVDYTAGTRRARRHVLSRFKVSKDDPNKADAASEQVILDFSKPYGNHNGCMLMFGPDGYLYASYGDGGAANDPHDYSQNLNSWLGKILRIDVNKADAGKAYSVPADNPFVGKTNARPEIWAYGLRNVWRMCFDREGGHLWAADVGQNQWEEVDLVTKGGNYGWNLREGFNAFKSEEKPEGVIDPIVEYNHKYGVSITGGYVYRGKKVKSLVGVYIYADYQSGRVWGLKYDHDKKKVVANAEIIDGVQRFITSFGEDTEGEVYVCQFGQRRHEDGRIMKFE